MAQFTISEWTQTHPRWPELVKYVQAQKLERAVIDEHGLIPTAHFLVATQEEQLVGFLMFLTQPIGPEMGCPILTDRDGTALTEAKIRAFYVTDAYRGQGIGTALQKEVLRLASTLGCYQVRSRSEFSRQANYAIKLKLGFVAHPGVRELKNGNEYGVYWIKRVFPFGKPPRLDFRSFFSYEILLIRLFS